MPDQPVAYKFLNGREATHVSGYRYRLGQWREVKGPLVACQNGLHLLHPEHLSLWIARDLFVAEYEGELLDAGDKIVVRRARIVEHLKGWNERTMQLAACDFAERVLPIFEAQFPNDDRPRLAIQAGRDYANGLISRDAAWAAEAARDAWAAEALEAARAARAARDARAARAAKAAEAARDAWAAGAARAARAAEAAGTTGAAEYARGAGAAEAAEYARAAEYEAQGQIILDYAYGRRS
jgi:hypothetical protein